MVGERELSRAFMSLSVTTPSCAREVSWSTGRDERRSARSCCAHSDEIGHPDPSLAISVAYGMYAAVVRGRLMFGAEHELYYGIDSATLYRELKKALTLYLRGEQDRAR